MPVFAGSHGQRGHGIGSLFSGFFRSALPMIKRGLGIFGKHALKTGLEMANDVAAGESFKDAAKKRVPEGIKRFVTSSGLINQPLPTRLVLGCVDNDALNGSYEKNPFNFKHFNLSPLKVYLDGQQQTVRP